MLIQFTFLIALLPNATNDRGPSDSGILHCQKKEVIGLFEQCQEILPQGHDDLGERLRAYERTAQQVRTVNKKNLFYARYFVADDKTNSGDIVAISEADLAGASASGFKTLCRIDSEIGKGTHSLLQVSCGAFQKQTILKTRALKLVPYFDKNEISTLKHDLHL